MGIPNTRNNSYFGGHGTSQQYKKTSDEFPTYVYNEPKNRKK